MKIRCLYKTIIRILFVLLLMVVCLAQISGVARAQVPQTSCSEIWNMPITVTDQNGNHITLLFGQGLFATDNPDDCDQLAPPAPPSGAFDARLNFNSTDYYKDYRAANHSGTIYWYVKYQPSSGGTQTITLSWNSAALPGAGTWTLRYFDGSTNVFVDMRTVNSVQLTDFTALQARIAYVTTRCTDTAVSSGNWNQASTWNTNCAGVPAVTDDVYIPNGIVVNFNGAAATVESLTIGSGGRLSFSTANQLTVSENAFMRRGTLDLGSVGNLTVNGALTNLGTMKQTLVVNANATQSFLNIGGYGGLTLTSHATALGNTTVWIIGGQICDSNNTSVWRCFTVTPTNSVSDAEVTFYYAANELNTSTCATIAAWRSTGGANWVSAGTGGTPSCASEPYSVSYTGVTIVNMGSYFSLRSAAGPTAITLRAFNANNAGNVFPILLTIGFIGLISLSGVSIWLASRKRRNFSAGNR